MLFLARMAGSDLRDFAPQLADSILLFFGAWDDCTEGRVLCFPSALPVQQAVSPDRPAGALPVLRECSIKAARGVSLPNCDDEVESWHYSEQLRSFGTTASPVWGEEYPDTVLRELYESQFGEPGRTFGGPHRAFGYPLYAQQHPAEVVEQLFTPHWASSGGNKTEFIHGTSRWIGLLCLESDDIAQLSFGDTGTCGFLITKEDLESLCFERVHFYQDSC